jgi:hypothetical protein
VQVDFELDREVHGQESRQRRSGDGGHHGCLGDGGDHL